MERTGEREIPNIPGTIEGVDPLHLERYQWASMFTRGKRVYDVACGSGYGSLLLGAKSYVGFDISEESVKYAMQNYGNDTTVFMAADACAMPLLVKTDVIVSFETIEHLKDPEAFLEWCAKSGETLLISTPIRYSFRRSHFHLFEYRLVRFTEALNRHFSDVTMLIQKKDIGITYPCRSKDKGIAVAICRGGI